MFKGPSSRLASNHPIMHHTVFDLYEYERFSQNVKSIQKESQLESIFLEKVSSLKATKEDLDALIFLHEKVKSCVVNYISEKVLFGTVVIVSCHDIGSLKMSTMLRGHSTSDLMCVFSGPISQTHLDGLNKKLLDNLVPSHPTLETRTIDNGATPNVEVSCSGFNVRLWSVSEKIGGHDPSVHISKNVLTFNKAAIKHAEWFSSNSSNDNVVNLVLLLKDLKNRFCGFKPLTPWLICLLAHYCVSRTMDRTSVDLHSAYRRSLKYMASGLFLSNSVGIIDPCEMGNTRAHLIISTNEQDQICLTAQYLANVGSTLGYDKVLELCTDSIEGPDNCLLTLPESIQI